MISSTLVLYFLLALVVSFACSILEAVLLSVSRPHIELLRQQGRATGEIFHRLKQRIDRPLIGILTLNTTANMFGSAGVGAETGRLAAARGVDDTLPVALAAGVLTFAILVLSEIIPKTLGASYWRQLAAPSARMIQFIVIALRPLIAVLEFVPRSIASKGERSSVSREEIAVIAEMSRASGSLPTRESEVITNLLRLGAMRVKDVMTPRVDVFALPQSMSIRDVVKQHSPIRYSRIPVYGTSVDQITGVVLKSRLLESCLDGKGDHTLEKLKKTMHIVPETKTLASILDEFTKGDEHLYLVVNEYGGTEGIITLEDVIETLLGVEIFDELDDSEQLRSSLVQHGRTKQTPTDDRPKT